MSKWPEFDHFHQYFDQIGPINYIFAQIDVHKRDRNNFYNLLGKNYLTTFPQILTYDVLLAPKYVIFRENGQNWVILGDKTMSYVKIWGKWLDNFFPKSL